MNMGTGDWDLNRCELEWSRYVDPPSCLKILTNGSAIAKASVVPPSRVIEGMVDFWLYGASGVSYTNALDALFRWQDGNNFYAGQLFGSLDAFTTLRFIRYVNGSIQWFANLSINWGYGVWHRCRIAWWNDPSGLIMRAWKIVNETPSLIGTVTDTANLWNTTGGRVGFRNPSPNYNIWVDLIRIYGV